MTKKGKGDKGSKTGAVASGTSQKERHTRMERLLGFDGGDLSSWQNFVRLMTKPCDPSSLAVWRIMFGLLMVIDLPQERGLSFAYVKWGDATECRFPLLNFLKPLPVEWMYVVYLIALIGALGLMFGFLYRMSCLLLLIPYWYLFLLDKTRWNNHSYLYGLTIFMFLLTDANRFWSLDGIIFKRVQNTHVPLWNIAIFRTQFFLMYFIAGLKKLDLDWVTGYSMNDLSKHWVFQPFTYILTNDQIDLFIVHGGGLVLDLTAGYLLFFDLTRPVATFFVLNFHIMNSQIFSIGMFPFTCIASTPLFYSDSWPKYVINKMPRWLRFILPVVREPDPSTHCLYSKEFIKPEERKDKKAKHQQRNTRDARHAPGVYHYLSTVFFLLYIAEQVFLPYSHGITKGYNNWTNGLYGYSWDMMVHSWSVQHIRIVAVDKDTEEVMYLNPEAWTVSKRWSSHADMTKQYAHCIQERLAAEGISNISLYFDVYRSLNDRFQQRVFDPRVDILTADWHPFREVSWVLPLMVDLSDWRGKLAELEKTVYNKSNDTDVVFIADFPGLNIDQWVPEDLGNTTLTILNGDVIVELNDQKRNVSLHQGDEFQVPAGEFHTVHTVSHKPSCYMYLYVNTTQQALVKKITKYQHNTTDSANQTEIGDSLDQEISLTDFPTLPDDVLSSLHAEDPKVAQLYEDIQKQKEFMEQKINTTFWNRSKEFAVVKYATFYRSYEMTWLALKSIWTGRPLEEIMNDTELYSDKMMDQWDSNGKAEIL